MIDNNLKLILKKRIHHHTLMPYNESEGLRLLENFGIFMTQREYSLLPLISD